MAFRQVLVQRQLNPLVTLWVLLVDWHALSGFELSLSHRLLALLVVLVCSAHCMLDADLAQLFWSQAAFVQVLLEYIHQMVKAQVMGMHVVGGTEHFG